jgi:hypothetical protein
MTTNKRELENGKTVYLWLSDFILNGSGDGRLNLADDLDWVLSQRPQKIYKAVLEEVETEEYEIEDVRKVKLLRVKELMQFPLTPDEMDSHFNIKAE